MSEILIILILILLNGVFAMEEIALVSARSTALCHIPVAGESFKWHTFTFEVADMDGARIDKLLVRLNTDDCTNEK